jgi:hypothetical protein
MKAEQMKLAVAKELASKVKAIEQIMSDPSMVDRFVLGGGSVIISIKELKLVDPTITPARAVSQLIDLGYIAESISHQFEPPYIKVRLPG